MSAFTYLRDPHFAEGVAIHGPRHEEGIVGQFPADGRPVWQLAQWGNYRHPLMGNTPCTSLAGGGFVLETPSTLVTVRPDSRDYDLRLELRSSAEYAGRVRQEGEDWCHLLAEQGNLMEGTAPLGQLSELRYQAQLRLDYYESRKDPAVFDPRRHACQVHQYFTVQDVVNNEFMWFGVTFFDSRYRHFPGYAWADIGKADATGHIIVNQPQEYFAPGVPGEKAWLTYDVDLLPLIRNAAGIAWGYQQFLKVDWNTTYITSTNIGWEMFYEFDGAFEMRNMQLTGYTK